MKKRKEDKLVSCIEKKSIIQKIKKIIILINIVNNQRWRDTNIEPQLKHKIVVLKTAAYYLCKCLYMRTLE